MEVMFKDGSVEQYVDQPFGGGSEGDVYRSLDGSSVVKIYTSDEAKASANIKRLDILIEDVNPVRDDPYWNELFAWPQKRVVRWGTQNAVGYRMRFAGDLKMLGHYIYTRAFNRLKPEERGWFAGRIVVAIQLASAADRLAKNGLSYPDFSERNIMVDPFNGRMVVIDCDSMSIPNKLPPTVEGTPGYCAPEIVMGQVREPSVLTDRHALAVLLYRWLLIDDPFLGDRVLDQDSTKDEELRYGARALYIEHPTDKSNRASKHTLLASMLGPKLEKLFQRAFVDGLSQPNRRPSPLEWQSALLQAYDQLVPCATPDCPWHAFVAIPGQELYCPVCQAKVRQPPSLPYLYLLPHRGTSNPYEYVQDIAKVNFLVGWPGKFLYQWHLRPDISRVYTSADNMPDRTPQAVFEYDETKKEWHLKNLAPQNMYYRESGDASDVWHPCPVGAAMPLRAGVVLQLGLPPVFYRAQVVMEGHA